MAFIRDDDNNALAVLALCDALETTDATRADEAIARARRHAQRVLERGKKKEKAEITPAEPEEGDTE